MEMFTSDMGEMDQFTSFQEEWDYHQTKTENTIPSSETLGQILIEDLEVDQEIDQDQGLDQIKIAEMGMGQIPSSEVLGQISGAEEKAEETREVVIREIVREQAMIPDSSTLGVLREILEEVKGIREYQDYLDEEVTEVETEETTEGIYNILKDYIRTDRENQEIIVKYLDVNIHDNKLFNKVSISILCILLGVFIMYLFLGRLR